MLFISDAKLCLLALSSQIVCFARHIEELESNLSQEDARQFCEATPTDTGYLMLDPEPVALCQALEAKVAAAGVPMTKFLLRYSGVGFTKSLAFVDYITEV